MVFKELVNLYIILILITKTSLHSNYLLASAGNLIHSLSSQSISLPLFQYFNPLGHSAFMLKDWLLAMVVNHERTTPGGGCKSGLPEEVAGRGCWRGLLALVSWIIVQQNFILFWKFSFHLFCPACLLHCKS